MGKLIASPLLMQQKAAMLIEEGGIPTVHKIKTACAVMIIVIVIVIIIIFN